MLHGSWPCALRICDDDITIVVPRALYPILAVCRSGRRVTSRALPWRSRIAYPKALAEFGDEVFVSLGSDTEGRRTAIEEACLERSHYPGACRQAVAGPGDHGPEIPCHDRGACEQYEEDRRSHMTQDTMKQRLRYDKLSDIERSQVQMVRSLMSQVEKHLRIIRLP